MLSLRLIAVLLGFVHALPGIEPIWEDPAHTNGKRLQVPLPLHIRDSYSPLTFDTCQFLVPKSRLQVSNHLQPQTRFNLHRHAPPERVARGGYAFARRRRRVHS